jgi:hypothetical protein
LHHVQFSLSAFEVESDQVRLDSVGRAPNLGVLNFPEANGWNKKEVKVFGFNVL